MFVEYLIPLQDRVNRLCGATDHTAKMCRTWQMIGLSLLCVSMTAREGGGFVYCSLLFLLLVLMICLSEVS